MKLAENPLRTVHDRGRHAIDVSRGSAERAMVRFLPANPTVSTEVVPIA